MRLYLLILATLFSISVFAQTGPGGVGNSSNNFLWLKVDDLSGFSDGDRISQWSDASGNSNHLSSSGTVRPYFRSDIQNTFPAVSFETPNNRLVKDNFASFPTSEITFIVLNKNDGQSGDGMVSYASSSAVDNDFLYYDSDNLRMYVSQNTTNSSLSVNDNNWHIIDGSWQSSGGNMEFWIDGNQDYTSTLSGGQSITANGCLSIGAEQDSPNGGYVSSQTHNGQFLEVIGYNMALNSAQRVILANYLANKYNLSISNDRYAYDFDYAHDMAGIGRYNLSNTHTEAQSAGILEISAPSGMNSDNEYLLFAHDDAGVSSWTTTNTPANVQRISREWRFDETGSMGTVSVTVDNSTLPALSGNYTKWGIMVDNDGDFSSGAEIYELAASGSDYVANNVDINDGDYVTIVSIDPYIEFETVTGSALEDSDASATISINYISAGNTSVDYSTVAGSATSGDDYTAVSGNTATISAGDRQTTISINVVDDSDAEPGETFKIQLSNPSTGVSLGANDEFTHTIYDNDNSRKVSFDASSSSATESVTSVSLGVSLSSADNSSNTYVDYDITGGTAETADYSFSSGMLTFDQGVTTATIDFSIINDNTDEYDQTIVISLSNPQNCNLQSPSAHTYTIEDDDVAPDIEFTSTSSAAPEDNASRSIGISLSAASEKDIQADIASSGSATLNTDYSIPSSVFEIKAGNSTGNFTLNIFDDNDIETNETVVLSMSSPVNAGLGTNDQHTHTIQNDDIVGYEGPGGVGKSEYVKLWTRAEDIPASNDGDRIATWDDISGNSNNLSQSNNSFRPAYYSGVVNGFPVARFDQDKNRLVHNSFDDFPTDEITTIFVNKNNNSNMDGIISYASSAGHNDYLLINSSDLTVYRSNHNTSSGLNIADNNFNIVTSTWNTSDDQSDNFLNGGSPVTVNPGSTNEITQGGCLALGAEQDAIDDDYDSEQTYYGDFAELIIFNMEINPAQRKIIHNYLSSKYDIALSANDMYAYDKDNSTHPHYYHNVSGIGRENSSNMHTDSKGRSRVRINNASSLGDGDYLFWGDDNTAVDGDINSLTVPWTSTPNGVGNFMPRVWRVDETGNVGLVTVRVDLSGWTFSSPGDLVLMIDSDDGDFENASKIPMTNFSGSTVTFNNVDFSAGDWFAVGEDNGDTEDPFPVELLDFRASEQDNKVKLHWTTASEINNDYFSIQRSADVDNWNTIGKVDGSGNSNSLKHYSFIDNHPINGNNYYRLKQYDFNGEFHYSPIVVVNMSGEAEVEVFPNPLNETSLNIQAGDGLRQIQIYDVSSRLLKTISIGNKRNYNFTPGLEQGIYFIQIKTENGESVTRKLIIN